MPKVAPPGAKGLGYYVEADGVQVPQPGDIIVLRNGVGKAARAQLATSGSLLRRAKPNGELQTEEAALYLIRQQV
jgi:hypothetical protein